MVSFFNRHKQGGKSPPLTDLSSDSIDQEKRRRSSTFDDSKIPFVTWRSVVLGAFVSIGGIIFGYDTGQISGFLDMNNFKQRFGQSKSDDSFQFSNVRSGLIVALVCICNRLNVDLVLVSFWAHIVLIHSCLLGPYWVLSWPAH